MNLPPFVYSLAFWKSLIGHRVRGSRAVGMDAHVGCWKASGGFLGILELFDIVPELRAKGLMK